MTEEGIGTNTNSNLEDITLEVTFPIEHEAPAFAGETTATAVSLYSAWIAMGVRRQLIGHKAAKLASQQMEPSLSTFPDLHTYHKGMAKSSTTR